MNEIVLMPDETISIKCPNPKNEEEWCVFRITALDKSYQGNDPEIFLEETTGFEDE